MTDVLKIALDRRAELHQEVAKLDEFIRMAETLIRTSQARRAEDASVNPGPTDEPRTPTERTPTERPSTVATDENSVRTAIRRAEIGGVQMNAEVSRPAVIRRGQAAG